MILSCPNCGTRYVLDAALLRPDGRRVRCARCSHTWYADPPASSDTPEPEPVGPPANSPPVADSNTEIPAGNTEGTPAKAPIRELRRAGAERRNLPALPRRAGAGALLGWAGLVLFVVVVVGGILLFPRALTDAWPPARQLYDILGYEISVKSSGDRTPDTPAAAPIEDRLQFVDLTPAQRFIGGVLTLVITGSIENTGGAMESIPPIEVVLLDANGLDLRTWTFEAPQKTVKSGASVAFETRLQNPPPEAQDIRVTFSVPRPH